MTATGPRGAAGGDIIGDIVAEATALLGPELPGIEVTRAVVGLYFTGVALSTGTAGCCTTPARPELQAACCPTAADPLRRTILLHRSIIPDAAMA